MDHQIIRVDVNIYIFESLCVHLIYSQMSSISFGHYLKKLCLIKVLDDIVLKGDCIKCNCLLKAMLSIKNDKSHI